MLVWVMLALSPVNAISQDLSARSFRRTAEMREAVMRTTWASALANALEVAASLGGTCDVDEMKRKGVLWMEPIDRIPQTPRKGHFVRFVRIPDTVPVWLDNLRLWAKQQGDGVVGLRRRKHALSGDEEICDITVTAETGMGSKRVIVRKTPLRSPPLELTTLEQRPIVLFLSVLRMVQIYYAFTGRLPEKL